MLLKNCYQKNNEFVSLFYHFEFRSNANQEYDFFSDSICMFKICICFLLHFDAILSFFDARSSIFTSNFCQTMTLQNRAVYAVVVAVIFGSGFGSALSGHELGERNRNLRDVSLHLASDVSK